MNIEIIEVSEDNVNYYYPLSELVLDVRTILAPRSSFKLLEDHYENFSYEEYCKEISKYEVIVKYDTYMFLWKKDCEKFIDEYLYPFVLSIKFIQ